MASAAAMPGVASLPSFSPPCHRSSALHHRFPLSPSCLHRQYSLLRLQLPRSQRLVSCASAAGSIGSEYAPDPIDVVARVQTEKIVVLGGSGFVGSAICRAAVNQGIEVVSLSRSGRPSYNDAWVDQVIWIAGDVFYADWDGLLNGATAVVSTLGGFGTNEEMEKLNGEANVLAVNAASNAGSFLSIQETVRKDFDLTFQVAHAAELLVGYYGLITQVEQGVQKFIYISVHDYNFPDVFKNVGYFTGKKRAEAEVLGKFTTTGTVLRPGFIYGKRRVNGFDVPLDIIGEPVERLLAATQTFTRPLNSLPGSDFFLASPVNVDDVAFAVIKALTDDDVFGVQTIEQIKEMASAVRQS